MINENIINIYLYAVPVAIVMLLIIIIIQFMKLKKLSDRFDNFIKINSRDMNIEDALKELLDEIKNSNLKIKSTDLKVEEEVSDIRKNIDRINKNLQICVQKTGVIRYNPFENVGGNLCFAAALLDKNNDGFVLNTIFTEAGCYTYCKPIDNCESTITLSKEEKEAIALAINKNS